MDEVTYFKLVAAFTYRSKKAQLWQKTRASFRIKVGRRIALTGCWWSWKVRNSRHVNRQCDA